MDWYNINNTFYATWLLHSSQICGVLGIVEKDYFGLHYNDKESGYKIWINKRIQVTKQLKTKPPYVLNFAVKYYTQPNYLLQSQTM